MASDRLYYYDAYTAEFTAEVVEQMEVGGQTAVVLNHSYFYPTSGGQPHDQGHLNHIPVRDVTIRQEDEAVLHHLAAPLPDRHVRGVIDWPRRFDHMQQHSGQHILSQAFIQTAQANTVSFHLSDDSVTIDLDKAELSSAELAAAEQLANDIIWQNRPIHVREVSLVEAQQLNLRKLPPVANGTIRLIDIENFDLTACGGTHVARTGGVGLIKIVRQERHRQQTRLEFCCGQRALADYGRKNELALALGTLLTTGLDELLPAVARLREQLKQTGQQLKQQQAQLLALQAAQLLAQAVRWGETAVVCHILPGGSPDQLNALANHLLGSSPTIALLGLAGPQSRLLFGRTASAPGDMAQLLRLAQQHLGGGGGGSAQRAQGGVPPTSPEHLKQIVAQISQQLCQ